MADRRVLFDFEIEFSNGGGLRGQGFRLDIEGDDIADEALADSLVRDMRLLMVGTVRIHNKTILAEAHKRSTRAAAARVDVRGKAVLLHTGWDAHWRTERYFEGHPFLTAAEAEWLAGHGGAGRDRLPEHR